MTDSDALLGRHIRSIYHPSLDAPDVVRLVPPPGMHNVRGQFNVLRLCETWHAGPMSQTLLATQLRWAELKLWILYYRLRGSERSKWPELVSLELRLACSWYFQSDFMSESAVRLARRVRNEFCVKCPKTVAELRQMAHVLQH